LNKLVDRQKRTEKKTKGVTKKTNKRFTDELEPTIEQKVPLSHPPTNTVFTSAYGQENDDTG
jgi:hypothetical protein